MTAQLAAESAAPIPVSCARCARPLPGRRGRGGWSTAPYARNLCGPCWQCGKADGTLADYPRRRRSRDELLDDWMILHYREGHSLRDIAERLGMKPASLERAIFRARAAGDPRAYGKHLILEE